MSRQYDEAYDRDYMVLPEDMPYYTRSWRDGIDFALIPGYRWHYVTSEGDVLSVMRSYDKPRRLRTWKNSHGHEYVQIHKKKYLVHRLVAEAFIPNPHNYPIVRHLNDIPDDNRVENLAWGTQYDNRQDSVRNGGYYHVPVYCFETDKIYETGTQAANELGVFKNQITNCCKGISKHAKGYHFCYADEMSEKKNDPNWTKNYSAYKPIIAIRPEGERIRFESRKEAAEYIGIPDCGISSVVNGYLKHTHGWRFEEGDR